MAPAPPPITTRIRWLYGCGAASYGIKNSGFDYFLFFYYNQVLGLSATRAGTAILIAWICDAIVDPLFGIWSDSTHSRWGRRHPFMYAAALPVAVAYYFIWNPPGGLSEAGLFWNLTITAVLVRALVSLYEVPSAAIVAELTENYDERTRLLALRYMFGWFGGIAMSFFMWGTLLATYGQKNPVAYEIYGAIGAVAMGCAIFASAAGLHGHIPFLRAPPVRSARGLGAMAREFARTLNNKNYVALLGSSLFAAAASGVSTNLNTYMNVHFWQLEPQQVQWIVLSYVGSAIAGTVLTPFVTVRLDKKRAALTVYGVSIFWGTMPIVLRLLGWFPGNESPALFPILLGHQVIEITMVVMFGIMQSSMLADVVEHSELSTGRREEGLFFAGQTFVQQATGGVGAFIAGMALTWIQFPTSAEPGAVPQGVIFDLGLITGPILMVLYLLALGAIAFYRIDRDSHYEHVETLRARAAGAEGAQRPVARSA